MFFSNIKSMLKPLNIPGLVASIPRARKTESRREICAEWCIMWIDFIRLQINNACVVFDIDDTLVDDDEQRIESICSVYHHCIRNCIPVFLVTARPDGRSNRCETKRMLERNKISGYSRLYMMPQKMQTREHTWQNISRFKYTARQHISQHHFIVCCFGDMWTDHLLLPVHKTMFKELMDNTCTHDCAVWFHEKICYVKLPET